MFKVIGNKLSDAGIKFSLPERFYLDLECEDGVSNDGLKLMSPEKDCWIRIITTDVKFNSAVDSLMDVFSFCLFVILILTCFFPMIWVMYGMKNHKHMKSIV